MSMHPQVSVSESQRTKTYRLVHSVYFHFPHVPFSCHISLFLSISTLPCTFGPLPHTQKHGLALRKCPLIQLPFHGGDEIFRRHSCWHLIACQHAHQLIWAGWSGLGPSAAKRRSYLNQEMALAWERWEWV